VGVMMFAGCPGNKGEPNATPPNMMMPNAAGGGGGANAVANEAPLPETGMENMPMAPDNAGMAPANTTPAPETPKPEKPKKGKGGKKK
jgi:hypothetical protein